jgi:type IV secretory pathway TrbD component
VAAGLRGPVMFFGVTAWFFGLVAAVEEARTEPAIQRAAQTPAQAD